MIAIPYYYVESNYEWLGFGLIIGLGIAIFLLMILGVELYYRHEEKKLKQIRYKCFYEWHSGCSNYSKWNNSTLIKSGK